MQSPKLIELTKRFDKLKKKLNYMIGFETLPPSTS